MPIVGIAVLSAAAIITVARSSLFERDESLQTRPIEAVREFDLPGPARPRWVAWIPNHGAVVAIDQPAFGALVELHLYEPRLSKWRRIALKAPQPCRYLSALFPVRVSVDEVAFVGRCIGTTKVPPEQVTRLYAYSLSTNRLRHLFSYPVGYFTGGFSLYSKMKSGVLNDGNGLYERLRTLDRIRMSGPLRIGLDRVGDPAIQPSGRLIMLPGAVNIRTEGPDRALAKWALFKLDAKTLEPEQVTKEYADLYRGGWSPDGRLYAFIFETKAGSGIGIFDSSRDRVTRLRRGDFVAVDWMSNLEMIAIKRRGPSRWIGQVLRIAGN